MPPIPVLKPRQVVRAFTLLGWEAACQRGSHIILVKAGHIATLRQLISRAGLTVEEFLAAVGGED